jgi:hypothetical protein
MLPVVDSLKIISKNIKRSKNKTEKRRTPPLVNVFTNKDYESNDGMLTTVWGPSAWHFIHTISFNYPMNPSESDKQNYMEFVLSLKNVLPCGKCRKNLVKNFKKLPLTMTAMENRATFSKYVYDLHEVVNEMLKKKSGLTYEDVRERYEHFRARCTRSKKPKRRVRFSKKISTIDITTNNGNKKEKGCVVPLYGEKSKCVLQIVPQDTKCDTFQIDDQCIKKQLVMS